MTVTTAAETLTGAYVIDPSHSRIGFVARHAMVTKVRGSFNDFEGTGYFDATQPQNSRLELTVQAKSIDTRNGQRDDHLRSNDFFAMEQYPIITFVSTGVSPAADGVYELTGDLTIKGVTQSVTVPFTFDGLATDPYGNLRAGFEGSVVVNRKDWGVSWNAGLEAGGVLVSDKIPPELEISAIKTA